MAPTVNADCVVKSAVREPTSYVTVPAGETHGLTQVTVKLVALKVAGVISSLNTALIVVLLGTPIVGPGEVVAGTVSVTRGRVALAATPVVNVHTYGLANGRLVARLVAPVMVAVYVVALARVPEVNVNVATVAVLSSATVPIGLTQGAVQVSVKVAAPLIGAIG